MTLMTAMMMVMTLGVLVIMMLAETDRQTSRQTGSDKAEELSNDRYRC